MLQGWLCLLWPRKVLRCFSLFSLQLREAAASATRLQRHRNMKWILKPLLSPSTYRAVMGSLMTRVKSGCEAGPQWGRNKGASGIRFSTARAARPMSRDKRWAEAAVNSLVLFLDCVSTLFPRPRTCLPWSRGCRYAVTAPQSPPLYPLPDLPRPLSLPLSSIKSSRWLLNSTCLLLPVFQKSHLSSCPDVFRPPGPRCCSALWLPVLLSPLTSP